MNLYTAAVDRRPGEILSSIGTVGAIFGGAIFTAGLADAGSDEGLLAAGALLVIGSLLLRIEAAILGSTRQPPL
ncbi:hypothetical protein [Micromonospora chersina]|uniref:hypothetical protein n=1 Tax=Micromonospora chersina TaxID=47854 RepID=UPI0037102B75